MIKGDKTEIINAAIENVTLIKFAPPSVLSIAHPKERQERRNMGEKKIVFTEQGNGTVSMKIEGGVLNDITEMKSVTSVGNGTEITLTFKVPLGSTETVCGEPVRYPK